MENEDLKNLMMNEIKNTIREKLRLFLAFRMLGANKTTCRNLMSNYKYKPTSKQDALLSQMVTKGEIFLIDEDYYGGTYTVHAREILDLLWKFSEEDYDNFASMSSTTTYYSRREYFRANLCHFLLMWKFDGEITSLNFDSVNVENIFYNLVRGIACHPDWSGILQDLDFKDSYNLLASSMQYVYTDLSVDKFRVLEQSIANISASCDNPERNMCKSFLYMFSNVLGGKIGGSANMEESSSIGFFASQAIYHHYNKSYSKALTAYRKLAKIDSIYGAISINPLFALFFIRAIRQESKSGWVGRLEKFDKYLNIENKELYLAAAIYADFIRERSCEEYVDLIKESWRDISRLNLVLSVIVLLHYKIAEIPKEIISHVEDIIDCDEFILLQLEASSSLPRYIARREELIEKLGVEPIFETYHVLEPWEKSIGELNELLTANHVTDTKKDAGEGKEASRIIYLVDDRRSFQPRIQKTKNGITWSKGRNIALSSFADSDGEYFTTIDKVVAGCVRYVEGWRANSYILSGSKVFAALKNHPLVFSASNQDIPVSIVGDTPYIRVETHLSGYTVTSNVINLGSSYTVVVKDSDVLYRVFELSALQYKIINLFEKQKFFPVTAKDKISKLLVDIAPVITVYSDITTDDENIKKIKGSSRITVQLFPISDGLKVEFFVKPLEDFNQYCKVGDGNDKFFAKYNDEKVVVERDTEVEKKNFADVMQILSEELGDIFDGNSFVFEDINDSLPFIDRVQNNSDIARVEWPKGARIKIIGSVDFSKLNLTVRSKTGWFELDGEVEVDKDLQLSLAELLERSRDGKGRFIELTKGEFLSITKDLKRKLSQLDANLSYGKKGDMNISQFSSGLVGSLEQEGVKVKKDAKFKALEKRILEAENVDVAVPQALQAELRDYQLDGYMWLARLAAWGAGACLADDMGLGKTVQSIALLLNRAHSGPSLIVAPASVVHNWQNELRRFAPSLTCLILHDNIADREEVIKNATSFDVVVTTYGLLNRIGAIITSREWNVILLDEAHNIKNRDTKSSKVAMNLKGDFRLVLTGTPIQNHLGEIWNLFNFTNPGLLGSFESFTSKFITPIEQGKDKLRQRELKRILQPFLLRRTKSEVLDELPTKTEIVHRVEFSKEERALYENIRLQAINGIESGELNPIQSLAEITRLRQVACHPALINSSLDIASSKVARFIELTQELVENNHRALVFSQFTSFLGHISKALESKGIPYLYLDGSTPIKEREKLVQSFQQGSCPIFLISLKAGGTGLNLTAADYVIHLDPWWNPAIEDQASDRSHRIGQTRPVTIYRLISKETIEDKILELHKSKKSLSDSLLEGSNMSHKLTREDMLNLLSENKN